MKNHNYSYTKTVRGWLILGLIMLLGQVILGGITRLTGSGLSITRWDVISGIIPPLNEQQWQEVFNLYKETPQFHKINSNFSIDDFKFIYFWEFIHRFWVRSLGLIFAIPFIIFVIRKKIDLSLVAKLLVVVILAALTASAGWIMVKSGLEDRPWVDAYKLTAHFILAVLTIAAMTKTIADVYHLKHRIDKNQTSFVIVLLSFTFIQLIFAGLMAGMKAALFFPTWPDMNGSFLPDVMLTLENWNWQNFTNYDTFQFAPAFVQFFHRILAYIIFILTYFYFFKYHHKLYPTAKFWITSVFILINIQVFLGIMTLLKIESGIPLFYAVMHQTTGILYFISLMFLFFSLRKDYTI